MRNLGVSANGSGSNGLVEVNSLMKDVRNGVSGEGKRLSEENESRINEDASDVNDRCVFQAQPIQQRQQQQLPGPVVRWERFLPVRSLCVLLVENDDSTRHIVSALLRNCSYEVTAVAHGLEAWKALEDPSIHIDLVLTEVVMPYLSGLGLLSKILSHKTYKSIPLIMMSSNDSMGIVFKCLSKGAVDFLVKPIRKNELKHIWQHVWRKCHTSSFSGSESGIRIQKPSSGSRNIDKAGIKNGSSGEDDNWSTDLNVNDGSDDGSDFGSDTQSSWSKRVVEFDSTRPITRQDESGDSPDSTCALVTHSRSEPATNNWAPRTATRERDEEGDKLVAMGKYLGIGVPINQELQVEEPNRKMQKIEAGKDNFFDSESKKDSEKFEKRIAKFNNEAVNGKLRKEYSDSMVVITNSTDPRMESATNEDDLYKNDIEDKTTDKTKKPPSLELELNSLQEGDTRTRTSDSKRNVLRHSDLSAFSRYNTTLNVNQTPTGIVGSCSPPENSSRLNIESNTDGTHNQCSNGSSNNDDMGSTTNTFPKPAYDDKKLPDTSTNTHLRSAFQPVKNSKNSSILPEIQGNTDPPTVQQKTTQQQVQVQHRHHYHHYHHHHHHVHNMQQKQQSSEHDNLSMRNTAASASHSGPSNNLTLSIDGNAAIYSLNASGSGSNNKSSGENCRDGPNDNNIVATAEGINVSSDNGGSLKCGADDGSRSGNRNDVDQNRLAQREAALLKFRQKRKDRCFEKKVRYQSRQKLAEQRPRVKGQFVRQVVNKDKNEYPNS